jgi:hypothetical protein
VRGWVIVGLLLALLVSGCENPYKKYYQPSAGLSPDILAQRRIAPPPEHPEVYRGNDANSDIPALIADGYAVIGQSSFNATAENENALVEQAKAVGADRVVIYGKYARTIQTAMPLTVPTSQTSTTTGTVFGSGGMATIMGNTTTYGSETTYVPMSIDRYDFFAVYLAKIRFAFGANYRNLTTSESQQLGSVNGVTLITIIHGSPAAAAGFVPGDIITKVNDQGVVDQKQFAQLLTENQGKATKLTMFRSGKFVERTVTLSNL